MNQSHLQWPKTYTATTAHTNTGPGKDTSVQWLQFFHNSEYTVQKLEALSLLWIICSLQYEPQKHLEWKPCFFPVLKRTVHTNSLSHGFYNCQWKQCSSFVHSCASNKRPCWGHIVSKICDWSYFVINVFFALRFLLSFKLILYFMSMSFSILFHCHFLCSLKFESNICPTLECVTLPLLSYISIVFINFILRIHSLRNWMNVLTVLYIRGGPISIGTDLKYGRHECGHISNV